MAHQPIYLVRHGEAAASWGQDPDPGLSELGLTQAKSAAERLAASLGEVTPHLVSSPLLRAQETAAPLAHALSATVIVNERFREIPAPVPLAQRQDWLRGFMGQRWDSQHESIWQWRREMLDALNALPAHSVVFTHFLVINTAIAALEQRDETLVFWPANASVTTLARGSDGLEVISRGEAMRSRVN